MNEEMVKVGLRVRLTKVNKTRELHGCSPRMEYMVGKTFTISSAFRGAAANTGQQSFQIRFLEDDNEYVWSPDDVQSNQKVIKPKAVKFDPSNLIY